MALRLSSIPSTSSTCGNPTLDRLLHDRSLSDVQKMDCLKTLTLIVKNLMDPIKSQDVKYRTLKLDNPKLQQKLFHIAYMTEDILQALCGFVVVVDSNADKSNDSPSLSASPSLSMLCLATPPSTFTVQAILTPLQQSMVLALKMLQEDDNNNNNNNNSLPLSSASSMTVVTSTTTTKKRIHPVQGEQQQQQPPLQTPGERLSEKQKARRLLQEQQLVDKQKAKVERQRQLQLLKEDKHTREHDPTWKPGMSAACAKSGTAISTFRDKFGE